VAVALWALVRAFGLEAGSLMTTAMFFTPYAAIAALLVAGVAVALRNWLAAAVAALATVSLAAAVLPRAIGDETVSAAGRETLTVLSANVLFGRADPDVVVGLVDRYDADVLSVQELTPSFVGRLRRAGLAERLPHSFLMPRPSGRGGGLYSRFPLTPLPRQTRFLLRMPRASIALPGGRRLRLVAVHPQPPDLSLEQWRAALRSMPEADAGAPWLLIGDFNAGLDHAEFRDLLAGGYRDAGDVAGEGLEATWGAGPDFSWGLIAIDHVLADRRLGVAGYGVAGLPGSDHRAIHAELVLPGTRLDGGGD
jgi:endonuclease/exonuclease/phosphatase (EEP) superfamily protein YafD